MLSANFSAHLLVFINHKKQVLLTQRGDVPLWVIPGGHMEKGEKPEETAKREMKEETGYDVGNLVLVSIYRSADGKTVKYLYTGEVIGGSPRTSEETRRIEWFYIDRLPPTLTIYERRRISDGLCFDGAVITREYRINLLEEVLNQLRDPIYLSILLFYAIRSKMRQVA